MFTLVLSLSLFLSLCLHSSVCNSRAKVSPWKTGKVGANRSKISVQVLQERGRRYRTHRTQDLYDAYTGSTDEHDIVQKFTKLQRKKTGTGIFVQVPRYEKRERAGGWEKERESAVECTKAREQ